jgi:PAS domain S-box-containing protein
MYSVLYVDDEPVLLDIGKIYLNKSGHFLVDTATSVAEAIEKLRDHTYDAIISDYQMTDIDGIQFLRYIREHFPDLPFILFTGRGREEIVIEALNSGADFYLQKGGEPKSQFAELDYKILTAIDRRRIRDELKESKKQLSDLINFLPDATYAIDLKGRVIVWNRMMEELTGVPPSSVLGTGNLPTSLPLYQEKRHALADCIVHAEEVPEEEYPNLRRSGDRLIAETYSPPVHNGKGGYFWLTASPIYDAAGKVVGAIESVRDITQRKETENKLKHAHDELNAAYEQLAATEEELRQNYDELGKSQEELHSAYEQLTATEEELRQNYDELSKNQQELIRSEERYRNVVEDQTEFICRFTPDGKLTFVNDAYCRYFDLDRQTCIGHHHTVTVPAEDAAQMKEQLGKITPENPVVTIDNRIVMPSGEVRWQRWSDRAIFDSSGHIIEFQSVGRDITDSKLTKQALYESNRKLNLLSSITRHDILNQLTILQGSLGLLELDATSPDQRKLLSRAIQSSEVILSQISFTQQYQDIGVHKPRWQNLHAAVTTVCMDDNYTNVEIDMHLNNYEVYADPLLRTVFLNLFENAAMHGGKVTRILVSGSETGDGFVLVVEDDGDGIAPEDKEQIFRKGVGKHTGLGLFLVQEVLGITGLSIKENGEFGRGARFEILVPQGIYRNTEPSYPS